MELALFIDGSKTEEDSTLMRIMSYIRTWWCIDSYDIGIRALHMGWNLAAVC